MKNAIGVDNPKKPGDVSIGCVAGDEDSYKTFGELLDQVIGIVHNGYTKVRIYCTYNNLIKCIMTGSKAQNRFKS